MIERKTYADLCSSIVDGRFREQRDRMRCTVGASKMVYVFEGFPTLYTEWDAKCVTSAFHLQHRDGIRVARTASASDTLTYVELLVDRVNREPDKYLVMPGPAVPAAPAATEYQAHLQAAMVCKKKGANLSASSVFRTMLSSIPGISDKIARNVEAKVGNLRRLMAELEALPDVPSRKAFLTSIDKVGDGKASSVLAFLGFA